MVQRYADENSKACNIKMAFTISRFYFLDKILMTAPDEFGYVLLDFLYDQIQKIVLAVRNFTVHVDSFDTQFLIIRKS